jgi:hypothetical protein
LLLFYLTWLTGAIILAFANGVYWEFAGSLLGVRTELVPAKSLHTPNISPTNPMETGLTSVIIRDLREPEISFSPALGDKAARFLRLPGCGKAVTTF